MFDAEYVVCNFIGFFCTDLFHSEQKSGVKWCLHYVGTIITAL